MTNELARLQDAIRRLHGCESTYRESITVKEAFRGQPVWDGTVEVFDLIGHPKAKRCYAWSHRNDRGAKQFIAVLEILPVCSAVSAVRAAIIAESKTRK